MTNTEPTIYAVSTPSGRGAIAIIRLSGDQCAAALKTLTKKPAPAPRLASLRTLYDPASHAPIDEALVLFFAAPHSFTGEDMAELHIHGGVANCTLVLAALAQLNGLHAAEAGAFSRRAVLHGRMDLTRAEGVADLIAAETPAQQAQAARQMRGALGALYESWRTRLTHALAHLEADIEFADEDLPGGIGRAALKDMQKLHAELAAHLAEPRGVRLRDGIEMAIIGAPNVGKSSLLNYLVGREAAIVSPHAGTTRDIVAVPLTLGGVPIEIADTAGLRVTQAGAENDIEREGMRRAKQRAAEADIRLFVSAPDIKDAPENIPAQKGDYHILNKSDLLADKTAAPKTKTEKHFCVSVKTGDGLDALYAALEKDTQTRFGLADHPAFTRQRHKTALDAAAAALARGLAAAQPELAAEDLRQANRALGTITGAVDIESLLDIVFKDFCIGK